MTEYRLSNEVWKKFEEEIAEIVKPFNPDPNISDYAIFIHDIPPEEAETDKGGNLFSKIKAITEEAPYCNGVKLKEPHRDYMRSVIGKEMMSIEIRRIEK
ncbi:MAG: hypothetical protein GTN40_00975 [Candidatus Aenigmarchaeota archaeon]|nr:hypothetical protein [Candidatus Aenigmarchaeota archaeon]